ncbi:MAG: ABC transporter permease [Candidatus Nephthysia bennettiae]|uniref:ABC transporter permease n=1 Tax=Candidatus Nephthysia bennettiae TaxID=3127016 RepID=A0A934NBQ1_9BACT|nr:ABC transporter permease [Candidatus Dormibacteraeota bacterium]MBJ7612974.1 ABC transporter permease [Candidatus Dormibacteraeota bacterium]PZR89398.1 MAG: ABC transporter permease [Candidatus Dormibacteraeota bacterium]
MASTPIDVVGPVGTVAPAGRIGRFLRRNLFLPVGAAIVLTFVLCALFPSVIAPRDPTRLDVVNQFTPPGPGHLLGTDEVGRDLFTRIVHGTRYSLGIAFAVVLIGASIGSLYGMLAGFVGGWVAEILMRIVDVFFSLPAFILAMAIAAAMGPGVVSLMVALVVIWWPGYARMVRGMVLSIKERLHVEGARALGARPAYIMRRHIFPFMLKELNVRVTQDMGYALVAVASLSFIGLGVRPPTPEWGLLLAGARQYITGSWWYPLFPGLAITIATLGFSLLGDALSELLGLDDGSER